MSNSCKHWISSPCIGVAQVSEPYVCPYCEIDRQHEEIVRLHAKLKEIRARCLNLAQWIDKGCEPKHGATEASFIALFAKEPSGEPNSCTD